MLGKAGLFSLEGGEVGGDAVDMEVNKRLLAFFAEKEVAIFVVVHEEVFGEDGGAGGVAEEVEVFLEIGETKPVKMPAVVDKEIVYRDSIVSVTACRP